jgi:hypothetical protein
VRRASDLAAGKVSSERLLPVLAELRGLLPGRGLRRGSTVGPIAPSVASRLAARAR